MQIKKQHLFDEESQQNDNIKEANKENIDENK